MKHHAMGYKMRQSHQQVIAIEPEKPSPSWEQWVEHHKQKRHEQELRHNEQGLNSGLWKNQLRGVEQ